MNSAEIFSNSDVLIFFGLIVSLPMIALVIAIQFLPKKQDDDEFGSFTARPLLNKSEQKVLLALDACVTDIFGPRARVFSQVSYGEFLKGEDASAHARINQKRADFVISDEQGRVLCIVEYHGSGHFGRGEKARANADYRDRVKRAAAKSAGIPMVEIPAMFTSQDVKKMLQEANGPDKA